MKVGLTSATIVSGQQDVTTTLDGLTPKSGILYASAQGSDGTVDGYSFTIGIFCGSVLTHINVRSQHNVNPTATRWGGGSGFAIYTQNNLNPSVVITFNTPIANGIRVTASFPLGAVSWRLHALMFAGNDLLCHMQQNTLVDQNSTITVSPNFEIKSGVFISPNRNYTTTGYNRSDIAIGFYGTSAKSYSRREHHNQPFTKERSSIRNYPMQQTNLSGFDYAVILDNVTTNAYDLTLIENNGFSDQFYGLVFNKDAIVTTIDTPTSTGTNYHNIGSKPLCVLTIPTLLTAEADAQTGASSGAFGFGVTTSSTQACVTVASESSAAPSDVEMTTQAYIKINQDTGASGIVAKSDSMDATGFTWNYSATLGTARKWPILAFINEEDEVPAPEDAVVRLTGNKPIVEAGGPSQHPEEAKLAITSYEPKIFQDRDFLVGNGRITVTGGKPTVSYPARVSKLSPRKNTVRLVGYSPIIQYSRWVKMIDRDEAIWTNLSDREEHELL